jgi:predicted GIY-YIG superfamily endonuclease
LTIRETELLVLWAEGGTLEAIAAAIGKTPTSVAHKLVRLGIFEDRATANTQNQKRGGGLAANSEHDASYTIYLVRNPDTNAPMYVGQTQNFRARRRNHIRNFSKVFDGKKPIIEELETVASYSQAREAERKRIAELSAKGFSLLNVLDRELCGDA